MAFLLKGKLEPHPDVKIRPAHTSDTSHVFAFLQEVWEGEDYVPSVWDEWLRDPAGYLVVAEIEGEPIATGRITNLEWGEYWLEGLRVAVSHRRLGVASRLQDHLLEYWDRAGGESVGYLTHRDQTTVHHLAAKAGFRDQFQVQMVRWNAQTGEHDFEPCKHLAPTVTQLTGWSEMNGLDGRMEVDWTYPRILPARLQAYQDKCRIWTWRGDRACVVLDRDSEAEGDSAALICLSVKAADIQYFVMDLMRLCSMLELTGGRWFVPLQFVPHLSNLGLDLEFVNNLEMTAYIRHR